VRIEHCFVQNLGNFCEILGILNSSLGNFWSTFVGTVFYRQPLLALLRRVCKEELEVFDTAIKTNMDKICNMSFGKES